MKKHLLTFLFLSFFINSFHAQVAIFKSTAFVDSVSQPGLKKYGVKLSFDGINVPVIFETTAFVDFNMTTYYGDSLSNLINSTHNLFDMDIAMFTSTVRNANNTNEVLLEMSVNPLAKNILSFPLVSSSNGLNCDGKIHFDCDTTNDQLSNFDLWFQTPGNGWFFPPSLQTIDTLCSGKYWVNIGYDLHFSDDSVTRTSDYTGFLIGQYVFPSATNLDVVVNPYRSAATPLCNGKARVSITNSVVPFVCSFDGGSYSTSDSIVNLCEGMHSVLVATANDTVGKYFIIANSNDPIDNPNSYGPVVDTIIYNFTNCNFNYNLPVDSAFLLAYNVIDSNTVYFSWQIWQQGVVTNISDTISYN